MNLAIIGYGKMGHAIEQCALRRGHNIALTIDTPDEWQSKSAQLKGCDVAVEFSTPATAVDNIRRCLQAGVPVVSGTTGWNDQLEAVKAECASLGGALFVASNFSIGMNIVFELNRRLARLTAPLPDYSVSITETHHIHKLDAPSGTAIHLANDIIAEHKASAWHLADPSQVTGHRSQVTDQKSIPVTAIRQGEVAGIHEIRYDSPLDTITLTHEAKGREGLALGATLAAEFLVGKHGFFTMSDLLKA